MELVPVQKQALTRGEFERLAEAPPEEEWLANITDAKTQRAYKNDVREFIAYAGLHDYGELRSIVGAHIIDWRRDMERRELEPATIRRKLSAFPRCSITSANAMPCPATRSMASSGPWPTAMKAAPRPSATGRRANCSKRCPRVC
jgi:hypothetical protein